MAQLMVGVVGGSPPAPPTPIETEPETEPISYKVSEVVQLTEAQKQMIAGKEPASVLPADVIAKEESGVAKVFSFWPIALVAAGAYGIYRIRSK